MLRIGGNQDLQNFEFLPNFDYVVRIATIGDGSCFFHSILNSVFPRYQEERTIAGRINMIKELRLELSEYLDKAYDSLDAINEFSEHDARYSKDKLKSLLADWSASVGDEFCKLVSDLFHLHIFLIKQNGAYIIDVGEKYETVIIMVHVGNHYETVGFMTDDGIMTIFSTDNPKFQEFYETSIMID